MKTIAVIMIILTSSILSGIGTQNGIAGDQYRPPVIGQEQPSPFFIQGDWQTGSIGQFIISPVHLHPSGQVLLSDIIL